MTKKFKLRKLASAIARAYFVIAMIDAGQSNMQGAAMKWCGPRVAAQADKAVSLLTGETDPFPGCKNTAKGGGCLPYLIDDLWGLGIRAHMFDMAIGGAGIADYVGRQGAVVQGNAAKPEELGYMDYSPFLADGVTANPNYAKLTGGTLPVAEGHADFDKFGLTGRIITLLQTLVGRYDAIFIIFSMGETDAGVTPDYFRTGLVSFSNCMLAHGASAVWLGLSSKPSTATVEQFDQLEVGRAAAVALLQAQDKPVYDGALLYKKWKDQAPMYDEARGGPRVHLVLRGQRHHSGSWRDAIEAAIEV